MSADSCLDLSIYIYIISLYNILNVLVCFGTGTFWFFNSAACQPAEVELCSQLPFEMATR